MTEAQVVSDGNEVSARVSPGTPKRGHGTQVVSESESVELTLESGRSDDGFAAAMQAITAVPLNDDEKAEVIRKLLAEAAGRLEGPNSWFRTTNLPASQECATARSAR